MLNTRRLGKPIAAITAILALAFLVFYSRVGAKPLGGESAAALVLSGTLEAKQTRISPEVSAQVVSLHANKGDTVKAGDVLIELDDTSMQAAMSEAESAVRAAQANLDQVKEAARPGALAVAQAGVTQAQADLDAAKRALDDANRSLASPQDLTAQVHALEAKVQAAQAQVTLADATLNGLKSQIESAQRDQSAAGKAQVAALQKQQDGAVASKAAAQADVAGSQRMLDLYRAMVANPLDLTAAQHAAASQVKVAEAGLKVAQAELAIVQRAPQAEAVALAEAKLNAAQSNLKLAQAQAKRYTITSPIDGVVVDRTVDTGETTRAGSAVLTLAQTNELQMTLYVPIRNLDAVRVGQAAQVKLPSLPGKTFSGKVTYIASESEFKPANLYNAQERSEVVFSVRVTVPNPGELKAGLPADATLQ